MKKILFIATGGTMQLKEDGKWFDCRISRRVLSYIARRWKASVNYAVIRFLDLDSSMYYGELDALVNMVKNIRGLRRFG